MPTHEPITDLPTHRVTNQPPPLPEYNLFDNDAALADALEREGGSWAADACRKLGQELGTAETFAWGHDANRFPPELRTFDRYGQRIDEVEFHPSYHLLMDLGMRHRLATLPWAEPRLGATPAQVAMGYMFTQVEAGVVCPLTMLYAVVPALQHQPDVAAQWMPRILRSTYDPRCIPADQKNGVTFGMAMTEKQGGSDVRANSTVARPIGDGEYLLTGHKWFCSAPMSDAFLTLAYTDAGLTCFIVPRFCPDGTRNNFFLQRLKNKLGNRSNASSEVEYSDTWAHIVGEEGRGVRTIIDMVHHTRLAAAMAPAGLMRQAVTQAVHHCRHRKAFGKLLIDQPLMRNVLADLALEVEAGVMLGMRIARAFDEAAAGDEQAGRLSRLGTAVSKYWLNKRCPGHIYEALECHGGAGYIEESILPRLYREAPLNSIWEGSGNVICLDVLRAMSRDPGAIEAIFAEIRPAAADDPAIARGLDAVHRQLRDPDDFPLRARRFTEMLAKLMQAALLRRHAPAAVADAFVASRLQGEGCSAYGTLPAGIDLAPLIDRASLNA
jgi:putative acyl-CoA dehydrogenase